MCGCSALWWQKAVLHNTCWGHLLVAPGAGPLNLPPRVPDPDQLLHVAAVLHLQPITCRAKSYTWDQHFQFTSRAEAPPLSGKLMTSVS